MKAAEIRELTIEDLKEKIQGQEDTYQKMKMDNAISGIENPISIRATRRTIARLKTELNAKLAAK